LDNKEYIEAIPRLVHACEILVVLTAYPERNLNNVKNKIERLEMRKNLWGLIERVLDGMVCS